MAARVYLDGVRTLNVAVLGSGTVGEEVLRILHENSDTLADRIGARVNLVGVAVRDADKDRSHLPVADDLLTTDAEKLASREDLDILIELIGGIDAPHALLVSALERGTCVVSANKALLATHGAQLHNTAVQHGADLYYEAAVGGAIPLLRPLKESLRGDRIQRVLGIVNGTTNYILTQMTHAGVSFEEALAEAQRLGYAEADPTADVGGFDAAQKTAILASLAFHIPASEADVYREGIAEITPADIRAAQERGYTIKALAIAERHSDAVQLRTHPTMIPLSHPLASVGGAYNAVFVTADAAGDLMFYGQGAGGSPTASAVLGDLVEVARRRVAEARDVTQWADPSLSIGASTEIVTQYHVRMIVTDQSGVLAEIARVFAAHDVSIATVQQEGHGDAAELALTTHLTQEGAVSDTMDQLKQLGVVHEVLSVVRVEDGEQ